MNNESEQTQIETPAIPEGAVLSLDTPADLTVDPSAFEKSTKEATPGAFMAPAKLMGILKKMVDTEQMTPEQARQMRRQFGITQSYFTGTKVTPEQKKTNRKIADASRKKNRYNGSSKGAKRSSGRGD